MARHGVAGSWWAATEPENWPQDDQSLAAIEKIGMKKWVMLVKRLS